MVRQLSLSFAATLLVASTAVAQVRGQAAPRTTVRSGPFGAMVYRADGDRLVLGISTTSGGARDTLGLLISSVTAGGPAEKAGLEEGNRLVAINGVQLRLNAADAADPEMAGVLGRRFQRELEKMKPGEAVTLRVYANGQTREVKVTPVRADELNPSGGMGRRLDTRATIGATLGGFPSPRDTMGVFVVSVAEDGPLAMAGVFEGSRIAAINGIDLRVPAADVGDEFMTSSRVRRLTREIEKLEAGASVELRVYSNGQFRNVNVKTVKRSDLKQGSAVSIFHSGGAGAVVLPPGGFQFDNGTMRFEMEHLLDGARIERFEELMRDKELEVRELLERLRDDKLRVEPRIRERSGSDSVMPVEDVLKALEQRLRQESPARTPFKSTVATSGDVKPLSSVSAKPTEIMTFEPAIARSGSFGVGAIDLQAGAAPVQGRSGGHATYRATHATAPFTLQGIRMSPIDSNLASYLGRGSERGLLVLEMPESWLGLTAGDVVLSIDGKSVRDGDGIEVRIDSDREQCVELLRGGATVKSVLRRK